MATLIFLDHSITLEDGSQIKKSCKKLGIPFSCEAGICGTCMVKITEGMENLSTMNEEEEDFGLEEGVRLACQARIKSGIVKLS